MTKNSIRLSSTESLFRVSNLMLYNLALALLPLILTLHSKEKQLSLVGTNDQMFFATGISFAIIIFVN